MAGRRGMSDRVSILLVWAASAFFSLFVEPNYNKASVEELLYYTVYNVALGAFIGFHLFDRLARKSLGSFTMLACLAILSGTLANEILVEPGLFGAGPINFEGVYYGLFEAAATTALFLLLRLARLLRAWNEKSRMDPDSGAAPETGEVDDLRSGCLFVRAGGETRRIPAAEILFMRAERDFTHIVCSSGKHFASESLKDLLEKSAPFGMVRVHKSFAVNLRRVEWLTRTEAGLGDARVPVGRRYGRTLADAWRLGESSRLASGQIEVRP